MEKYRHRVTKTGATAKMPFQSFVDHSLAENLHLHKELPFHFH